MSNVYNDIVELIFAKYRNSPIILKVLEIISVPIQDSSDAIDYFLDHLSIDDAEGPILDALASWIGVDRPLAQEQNIFWLRRREDVLGDPLNQHGLTRRGNSDGGYLTTRQGCSSKQYPGTYASDAEFRLYIRAKASTFRTKAVRDAVYTYVLQFGVRCKIAEDTRAFEIEPSSYDDLNYAIRYHILNRGYRPSKIDVSLKRQTESDSEI
jgi:hypothetical protein